ncbi:MAG TPA: biopolymer transporter ExbD [Solimonas sp.]|nr:biopolymer transporter ExbD [Solimonas sp.]
MTLPMARRMRLGDNMLPVINIVFLLLIFFMLLGAISAPDAFMVRPPESAAQAGAEFEATILVLGADGRLGLGRSTIARQVLAAQASAWGARHPGQALQVKADGRADAAQLVEVLETLRAAGIPRVALLTTARRAAP